MRITACAVCAVVWEKFIFVHAGARNRTQVHIGAHFGRGRFFLCSYMRLMCSSGRVSPPPIQGGRRIEQEQDQGARMEKGRTPLSRRQAVRTRINIGCDAVFKASGRRQQGSSRCQEAVLQKFAKNAKKRGMRSAERTLNGQADSQRTLLP